MRGVTFFGGLLAISAASFGQEPVRDFLDKNCTACHRAGTPPAGIDFTSLTLNPKDQHNFNTWVRVHDAVRKGAMPPGAKVAETQKAAFLKSVAAPLSTHEKQVAATQGRSVLRRLNRYEYENTVRDLLSAPWLQLKDSLPEDGIVARFNKSGRALDVSHVQMSRYMETADDALRLVLKAAEASETTKRYYARDQKRMIRRMIYDSFNRHPERATIPILGIDAQPEVIAGTAPLTDPKNRDLEGFATPAGNYVGNEHHFDQFVAPAGGKYKLRFNAFSIWIHSVYALTLRQEKISWWRPDRDKTSKGRTLEPITVYAYKGGEKRLLGSFDVGPEPSVKEMDVYLLPGESILPDAARLFRSRPGFKGNPLASQDGMPGVAYRWLEVTGPYQHTPALSLIPAHSGDVEIYLRRFLAVAYRRPPTEAEAQRFLKIVQDRLSAKNADLTEAMIAGYTAILCSPGFLYMEEKPGRLDGNALASRLSYFLWNGPPDAELRALAANGTLTQPAVLRAQTTRLLDDPRSRQFIDAFLDYWLDLRKLGDTTPDQTLYPEYYLDDLLTESARAETQIFIDTLVRRNLPASNIVQSGFTFVNSHLARHYSLPPVEGVNMREVKLPADGVRGGLLTQASILKVTANGTTTSPVLRGVWIMERILGDPPPPPPPGVPAVEPDTRGATTIRQQLDKHRSIASCAACHKKIDPPGFALESFDVLGAFRERYRSTEEGERVDGIGKNGHAFTFKLGQPVDASGQLVSGESFRDTIEFKRLLLKDERQIARNMVTQFIAYGTGTPVSFSDREVVERILDASAKDRYRLRTLLHNVIQSELFRNK